MNKQNSKTKSKKKINSSTDHTTPIHKTKSSSKHQTNIIPSSSSSASSSASSSSRSSSSTSSRSSRSSAYHSPPSLHSSAPSYVSLFCSYLKTRTTQFSEKGFKLLCKAQKFKPFLHKQGQFYIFTALLLIGYASLLLTSYNVVPEASKNFRNTYDNFLFESSSALNNALFEGVDVNDEYDRFLDRFISYSKMKKLNIEIFSMIHTGGNLYFSNKLNSPVYILNFNETITPDTNTYFSAANHSEVILEVGDDVFHENIYKFTLSSEDTEAKAIIRIGKGVKREIFVQE